MVNDGSTDNSAEIALQFADNDARFVYIDHTVNRGSGAAYNTGLAAAYDTECEYICFLDNDDLAEAFMVKSLYDTIRVTDAPVAFCEYMSFNEQENKPSNIFGATKGTVLEVRDSPRLFHTAAQPWNKIYRTEFMRENKDTLRFAERAGLQYADTSFFVKLLLTAEHIAICPKRLVYYRIYAGQSMQTSKDPTDPLLDELWETAKFLTEKGFDGTPHALCTNYRFVLLYFFFLSKLADEYKARYKNLMRRYFADQTGKGNLDENWRTLQLYEENQTTWETERVFD
jgi:glycosyltransferase involved in cell wall biosynthesis